MTSLGIERLQRWMMDRKGPAIIDMSSIMRKTAAVRTDDSKFQAVQHKLQTSDEGAHCPAEGYHWVDCRRQNLASRNVSGKLWASEALFDIAKNNAGQIMALCV